MCRLFDDDVCICPKCQDELDPKFVSFKVDGYKALAVYEYTPFIKNLIYLYKGCFDYELNETFLNLYIKEIEMRFCGYKIIPIPSYVEDDKKRGFNHVLEAFKKVGLEVLPIIEKTAHQKQADQTAKKRKEIGKYLAFKEKINLGKTKVLIVDDIYTTGSTMRATINMVERLNPKDIKVLVLAKTSDKGFKKVT
ncbi:MAG: ComF family protein [Bacilli bacterium]|nr:ComF family protein [Bacilli bacterium]